VAIVVNAAVLLQLVVLFKSLHWFCLDQIGYTCLPGDEDSRSRWKDEDQPVRDDKVSHSGNSIRSVAVEYVIPQDLHLCLLPLLPSPPSSLLTHPHP
jgi:hypothetical protein